MGSEMCIRDRWYLWYGLTLGLTYDQSLDLPFGELMDLISIEQIKHEGMVRRRVLTDEDIIPDVR